MRLTCFFLLLLLISNTLYAQQDTIMDEHLCLTPSRPQFPGGEEKLMKFLGSQVYLPKGCEEIFGEVSGKIILQFLVDAHGYPQDLRIIRIVHPCFLPIIEKIWAAMPCWIPGESRGKPVKTWFTLPIRVGM